MDKATVVKKEVMIMKKGGRGEKTWQRLWTSGFSEGGAREGPERKSHIIKWDGVGLSVDGRGNGPIWWSKFEVLLSSLYVTIDDCIWNRPCRYSKRLFQFQPDRHHLTRWRQRLRSQRGGNMRYELTFLFLPSSATFFQASWDGKRSFGCSGCENAESLKRVDIINDTSHSNSVTRGVTLLSKLFIDCTKEEKHTARLYPVGI